MDLRGTCFAQHRDDLARGRAAHDRIVDHDQALAADVLGQRVELHAHTTTALLLARLDERTADVAILHQAVAVRDARRARVALGRGDPRLGNRHHHVGFDRGLAGELFSHALARGVHTAPVEVRIGPGEVHELEETQ